MLTDEMIRQAATQSSMAFTQALEQDYNQDTQYAPSNKFEKRIRKLSRKANHPYLHRTLQRVASVVLAILITSSVWLTFDVRAREAFFGWVKEVYEEFFVYRSEGVFEYHHSAYILGWIPDGYTELFSSNTNGTTTTLYSNNDGKILTFSYGSSTDNISWFVNGTDTVRYEIAIGTVNGDLFLSTNSQTASAIVWIQADNTAFYLSGFLDVETLLQIANSVAEK